MPELPEVEIIVRRLRKFVISAKIDEVGVLDKDLKNENLKSLVGESFKGINRRGKYILFIYIHKKYSLKPVFIQKERQETFH